MLRNLTFIILLVFLYSPLKSIYFDVKMEFSLSPLKDFKDREEVNDYEKSIGYAFAKQILDKYYNDSKYKSPTFIIKPWENGFHILLDGYRAEEFRVQNEYLLKNSNNLAMHEAYIINSNKKKIKILDKDKLNLHGLFVDLDNPSIDASLIFNDIKKIEIKINKIFSCENILNQKNNILQKDNDLKKIKTFKNCYFFEIKDKNDFNYTIELNNNFLLETNNIKSFFLYGNDYPIKSYLVLERYKQDYNYFFAKSLD